jgi:chromosome segregation ATPase
MDGGQEKERRYLVSDLQDRNDRLEKADAALISLEQSHNDLHAQLDQVGRMYVCHW